MFDNIGKKTNLRLRSTPYFTVLCLAAALLMAMLSMVVLGGAVMVLGWLADGAWAALESYVIHLIRQVRW